MSSPPAPTTSQYVAVPFHSHVVGRTREGCRAFGRTSTRGRYHVGGWLVSSTRYARVVSAMTRGAAASPTVTSTRLVDGLNTGGRGYSHADSWPGPGSIGVTPRGRVRDMLR